MKITKLHFLPEESCNTYIIGDEGKEAIVIDPGSNRNGCLDKYLAKHHSSVSAFLLTHGHYDHIYGLKDTTYKAPIYLSDKEIDFLTDPDLNLTSFLENDLIIENIDTISVFDKEKINLNGLEILVIETPFHTIGSVCYYFKELNALFSGDTLFHLGIGRSDLPTGSERTINSSLKKLASLPKETIVYPGHGENTTLDNEFAYNQYMKVFFK